MSLKIQGIEAKKPDYDAYAEYKNNFNKPSTAVLDIGSKLNGTDNQVAYAGIPNIGGILNGSQGSQSTASGIRA